MFYLHSNPFYFGNTFHCFKLFIPCQYNPLQLLCTGNSERVRVLEDVVCFDMCSTKDDLFISRQDFDWTLLDRSQGRLCFDQTPAAFNNVKQFTKVDDAETDPASFFLCTLQNFHYTLSTRLILKVGKQGEGIKYINRFLNHVVS